MKGVLPRLGWVLAGLALLVSLGIDFCNTAKGGAIDLRNRITGVRLMEAGIDPYHYKWQEGDPHEYCDVYNNPNLNVSKTTVTPALLLLHAPYAGVPYRLGQILWFFTQWVLLLGTGLIWWRSCAAGWRRWAVVAFVVGFTYTAEWRLHAERGQSYVLLACAFSAWLALTMERKWGDTFAAGFLAGLLAAMRPPFLLLGLFMKIHRPGQIKGALVGLLVGVILPTLVHPAIWPEYFSAVRENAYLYLHDLNTRPGLQNYPPLIENVPTDTLAHFEPIPFADFSIHAELGDLGIHLYIAWPFELVAVAGFAAWLWLSQGRPARDLLPGLASWFFVIDLCLPVFRQSYNDVLALALIGSALVVTTRIPWALGLGALALGAGWFVAWDVPDARWQINLPALAFTIMALALIFFIDNRFALRKVETAC